MLDRRERRASSRPAPELASGEEAVISVFLGGDVMTGRGVDQILAHPCNPRLRESYVKDARFYVELVERANGAIDRPVEPAWIWGDALAELERRKPDARIVNLETSVTVSDDFWPGKEIHYRMHPANIACLTAAGLDLCVLANNHVLDFGYDGLAETLRTLHDAGLKTAGAGPAGEEAQQPAIIDLGERGRVAVTSVAITTSGVPEEWAATPQRAGVEMLPDLSEETAMAVAGRLSSAAREGDVSIVSIHWGSNWGYDVPEAQRRFARTLVDSGVDIVHGHSSHHPRPIEVYRRRLILYGCGDLITDYEGISGKESFRGDLAFLYLPSVVAGSGELLDLTLVPVRVRRMRLQRASEHEVRWLAATMNRCCKDFGCRVWLSGESNLRLGWE